MSVPNFSFLACLEVARLDKLARLARLARLTRLEGLQNNLDSILYPNPKPFQAEVLSKIFYLIQFLIR